MSDSPPQVTICVPVYNGQAHIRETLSSISRQSYRNLNVLISDDASTDGSVEICRSFAQDPRFSLTLQPARRGWVANANWLLQTAPGDFVCITPHDDILDERYVETLVECLRADPRAAMAFCDVHEFGELDQILFSPELCGSPVDRLIGFIGKYYDGTAYRGLVRREVIAAEGVLEGNSADGFAADLVWLARVARAGELRRVPQVLYSKRRHHASASLQWGHWSEEMKREVWCVHCRQLLDVALGLDLSPAEQLRVVAATVRRLLQVEPALPFPFIRSLPRRQKLAMVASLLGVMRGQ